MLKAYKKHFIKIPIINSIIKSTKKRGVAFKKIEVDDQVKKILYMLYENKNITNKFYLKK